MAAAKGKKYSSDRRKRYQELRDEGRVGPQFGKLGGRPPKRSRDNHPRPAAKAIAEAAREHADDIAGVFRDVLLDPHATDTEKLRAVKTMVGIETGEERIEREDRKLGRTPDPDIASMSREELVASLAEMFNRTPQLRSALAGAQSPSSEGNGSERA